MTEEAKQIDFKLHAQSGVSNYLERRDFCEELDAVVRRILEGALKRRPQSPFDPSPLEGPCGSCTKDLLAASSI
jgi:hypothetical protein